jgi:Rieske Fe-S protein
VIKASDDLDNTLKYARGEGTWYSDKAGKEVYASDFEVGLGAAVIWRGRIPAILIKLDQSKVNSPVDLEQGFAAFSSKCTHLCCVANWHLDRPDMDMIFCRCHDGIVNPYNIVEEEDENGNLYYGAAVVSGPVPRSFPMIPVEIIDGKIKGVSSNLEWYDYC